MVVYDNPRRSIPRVVNWSLKIRNSTDYILIGNSRRRYIWRNVNSRERSILMKQLGSINLERGRHPFDRNRHERIPMRRRVTIDRGAVSRLTSPRRTAFIKHAPRKEKAGTVAARSSLYFTVDTARRVLESERRSPSVTWKSVWSRGATRYAGSLAITYLGHGENPATHAGTNEGERKIRSLIRDALVYARVEFRFASSDALPVTMIHVSS